MNRKEITPDRIFQITSIMNSSENLQTLLDTIMVTIKEALQTEGCSLLLYRHSFRVSYSDDCK